MNRECYGNVGTCPCTSQRTVALLLCVVDLLYLMCRLAGRVCGGITAVVFSRRRFFDLNLLWISLDWHGILAVLSPLASHHRLDISVLCGLYICVVAT